MLRRRDELMVDFHRRRTPRRSSLPPFTVAKTQKETTRFESVEQNKTRYLLELAFCFLKNSSFHSASVAVGDARRRIHHSFL